MKKLTISLLLLPLMCALCYNCTDGKVETKIDDSLIENGIHIATGLAYDENFQLVRALCTSCHSAKLITQNRATREGWKDMIVWMQKTQKLPDLSTAEPIVLDYLAKHYAPEDIGRRSNLDMESIEWYVLSEEE